MDRWSNRDNPTFLKYIPFKVRISKLHDIYRHHSIVEDIGSKLGHVEEVTIVEPNTARKAQVSVKILFDVDGEITLARMVDIMKDMPPVEIEFRFLGLQKFCTLCGSLKHEYELCSEYPKLKQRQFQLMDIGTNPYASAQQRCEAISEYISIREVGESSAAAASMKVESSQGEKSLVQRESTRHEKTNQTQVPSQTIPTTIAGDQGTKRKTPEDEEDQATTSAKRIELEQPNYGSVVLLKPQGDP